MQISAPVVTPIGRTCFFPVLLVLSRKDPHTHVTDGEGKKNRRTEEQKKKRKATVLLHTVEDCDYCVKIV